MMRPCVRFRSTIEAPSHSVELAYVRKPDSWINHASAITGVPWIWLFHPLSDTLCPEPSTPITVTHSDLKGQIDPVYSGWTP
jgi:hypothetical protein